MTILKRHPGAPYRPGEKLDGTADLEVDVNTFVVGYNSTTDNSNIAQDANLTGSQVKTFTNAKFEDESVTTDHIAALGQFATGIAEDVFTTSATFVDVPDVSNISVTPATSTDILVMTFQCYWTVTSGTGDNAYVFS